MKYPGDAKIMGWELLTIYPPERLRGLYGDINPEDVIKVHEEREGVEYTLPSGKILRFAA
jgi:hypothetical protein